MENEDPPKMYSLVKGSKPCFKREWIRFLVAVISFLTSRYDGKRLLADIAFLSFDKVKFVMDRGFYSEDNINALYQHHFNFLIAVKKTLGLVQIVLDEVRESMLSRASYDSAFKWKRSYAQANVIPSTRSSIRSITRSSRHRCGA